MLEGEECQRNWKGGRVKDLCDGLGALCKRGEIFLQHFQEVRVSDGIISPYGVILSINEVVNEVFDIICKKKSRGSAGAQEERIMKGNHIKNTICTHNRSKNTSANHPCTPTIQEEQRSFHCAIGAPMQSKNKLRPPHPVQHPKPIPPTTVNNSSFHPAHALSQ